MRPHANAPSSSGKWFMAQKTPLMTGGDRFDHENDIRGHFIQETHVIYFVAFAQTGSPLSNTIRQVLGASSRQIELNRPTTLSFTITGPVLRARSPDASTST